MMLRSLLPVAALLALAACSTYRAGYDYTPAPVTAVTESGARVLATVHGVRRASSSEGLPETVEVRFRVEAPADRDVVLQRESLHAVSTDFTDLPLVAFGPEGDTTTRAGELRVFTALFGLPPGADAGDVDLSGLEVRWRAVVGGRLASGSASFDRIRLIAPYPYHWSHHHHWGWPYHRGSYWSFGVGYHHW